MTMASLLNVVRRAASVMLQSSGVLSQNFKPVATARSFVSSVRCSSSYNPYPNYEETPDPYTFKRKIRYGYKYKVYAGGVLPRPKGRYEDIPLPVKRVFPQDRDQWKKEKALFGQNDYIDILGDGAVHPVQLMEAPAWLRGFKGNELQRLIRRIKFQGRLLQDKFPAKYTAITHRIWILYKKMNRRKRTPYWGGRDSGVRNRRFKFDKR